MKTFAEARAEMVERQLRARGIVCPATLAAMGKVPRELFTAVEYRSEAYDDNPLPIGAGQTISQPYMVARMTELLELKADSRALEIGTGCGYQTAVLAEICSEVFSLEVVYELVESARKRLAELGYERVNLKLGDGFDGWPEYAPFDAIIVTAAPLEAPEKLLDQLAEGGRMVIPLGESDQWLYVFEKSGGKIKSERLFPVRFVPMRYLQH
jgi:protein-L-isoaspartate(D-aspartate) O-methyltransferase